MASIKNYFLYTLIAASSISLTACGGGSSGTGSTGGGSGGSGTTTSDITFSGQIYDAAIPNAEIEIYAGDKDNGGKLLGTVTADINGNYSLKLTISSDDNDKPLIIHATSGTTKLVSIADDVGSLVGKARTVDGKKVLNANDSTGLNVTNVSTANFALIKNKHGGVPTSKAALEQVEDTIKNDSALQTKVIEAAAAIKAVIDQAGVSLPAGFDTEQLVVAVVAALVDSANNEGSTFIAAHSTEIANEKTNIENDDKLASQFISGGITASDLSGIFAFSESDSLVEFVDSSNLNLYEYDNNSQSGGLSTAQSGTYTFNESSQTLSITMSNNDQVSVKILGGSNTIFGVEVTGPGGVERGKMFKTVDASTISAPFAVFDTEHSQGFALESTCDGSTINVLIGDASQGQKVSCTTQHNAWILNQNPKLIIIPLAGTSATSGRVNYAAWSMDSNNEVDAEKGTAFYTKNKTIGTAGTINFHQYPNGKKILSTVDTGGTTRTAVGQLKDGTLIAENTKFLDAVAANANPYSNSTAISVDSTQGDTSSGKTVMKIDKPTSDPAVTHTVVINDKSGGNLSIQTRKTIKASILTSTDISGKTFEWKDTDNGDEGTIEFTSTGSANLTDPSDSKTNTWTETQGQVVMTEIDGSYSKLYKLNVDLGTGRFIIVSAAYDSSDVFKALSKFVVKQK